MGKCKRKIIILMKINGVRNDVSIINRTHDENCEGSYLGEGAPRLGLERDIVAGILI